MSKPFIDFDYDDQLNLESGCDEEKVDCEIVSSDGKSILTSRETLSKAR